MAPTREPNRLVPLALTWGGGILIGLAVAWMALVLIYSGYYIGATGARPTVVGVALNTIPPLLVGGLPALIGRAMWRAGRRRRRAEPLSETFD